MKKILLGVLIIAVILIASCTKPDVFEPVINNNSTPSYAQTDTIGESGSGDGQFSTPTSVYTGGNYLYVNDYGNGRIAKFTLEGRFVKNISYFPTRGAADYKITINERGNIYSLDAITYHLYELSSSGALIQDYGVIAPAARKVYVPPTYVLRDIEVALTGHFYVLHEDGNIDKFDKNAVYLKTIGGGGETDGKLSGPIDMAVGPDRLLYIVDVNRKTIEVLSPQGDFVRRFGNDVFGGPNAITIDKMGYVYVTDTIKYKVYKFKPTGELVSDWDIPTTNNRIPGYFMGISVDDAFKVYVSDGSLNTVHVFSGN